jgi:hypothetical protein
MPLRLFFVTDVHGSDATFRKFLNALRVYNVNVGIILGDLSGKMINPIITQPDGSYACNFMGQEIVAKTADQLSQLQKRIAITGNYYAILAPDEVQQLMAEGKTIEGRIDAQVRKIHLGAGKIDDLFLRLVVERLEAWGKLMEERLKDSRVKVFIAPGNDDLLEVNQVLDHFKCAVNADDRMVNVEGHEMITLSWSNPTPWDTPRECSEEKLSEKIEGLASHVQNMENAIFNFHVPPYGTHVDSAYKLSKDLVPSVSETASVGSTAVLDSIKKYQPLLGLHGHIHESRGVEQIGRTVCVNPGSEYSEGILRGVIVTLDGGKVKNTQFTSG